MNTIFTDQEKSVIQFLLGLFVIGLAVSSFRDYNEETISQELIVELEEFKVASKQGYVAASESSNTQMKPVAGNTQLSVNINSAGKSELMKLPKIGPVTAERIIRYRDDYGSFKIIDDLSKVKGIGSKTLDKIRAFVEIE
ncbi:MAG: helix-hairpin-helix domain-containing protein [Candidatus Marinimicrobia bacterium]|jgi:competence protein ComEA|nr:helix-hairpin-helix domain-containing protein [Candidatus Neomarinimicrobiota bacterium]MBT3618126.1 helix-hairpin-helix domain-containing protein [Candidatus Neomarinimicrobiota bacterium]MBT3828597.1 helix-hairpin-helix domain-containing protein [Candidatus Neomarinimicrobiota bacterium]MBT3996941.1 helix-hairpin-helix domain-containing protein [Candidatus Neomarinimicrobiota bacterium]MBT4280905.1 helix-hairpin-helix domain-containing protein [Candidatus Neomarinimicrobiota bacterium]